MPNPCNMQRRQSMWFSEKDQMLMHGEPGWDRTNDHLIKSQMLYR